ncbi:transposase [Actinopolymorpha rutila]|uniref:Transposase n=1 Tax=Actinopolymorpha rutila TaxID=446787 RepID=A0A852ZG42_9ACTN|nr:transposase [Actinopolymorpha rutila]NYH87960.1 transposase [Actinopolymorpha rutila]
MGLVVQTLVRTIREASAAIRDLEAELASQLADHPDAEILRSVPGLGVVSGGRVLGEFGDAPARFADAGRRRCYAGTAPVTRASTCSRLR